jgi:hypothetical protein
MDQPIPPEPAERPRVRKALRAARAMRWLSSLIIIVASLASLMLGAATHWYAAAIVFVCALSVLCIGYSLARCPRCGQVWWGNASGRYSAPYWYDIRVYPADANEIESLVCRRCRLDIRLALREDGER